MPFTPFHVGPVLFLWAIFLSLDIVALLIGATIFDAEGLLYLFGVYPVVHGPLHSILGAFLVAIIAAVVSYGIRMVANRKLKISTIFISGAIGSFSHIFLDAFLYSDINLAWPLGWWNPLLGMFNSSQVYIFCIATFIVGAFILIARGIANILRKEKVI